MNMPVFHRRLRLDEVKFPKKLFAGKYLRSYPLGAKLWAVHHQPRIGLLSFKLVIDADCSRFAVD